MSPAGQQEPSTSPGWSRQRLVLVAGGLLLLGIAWLALSPQAWLERIIPPATAGTSFNLSLVSEARIVVVVAGLGFLTLAMPGRPLAHLGGRMANAIARTDVWLRKGRRWPVLLLVSVVLAAAILALYSIARHNAFNSKAYDLGLHAQVYWNTSQGRLFASSVEVDNYLGDHVSPIILLLSPLYWLWPDPRSLLLLQAVALASGALPLAWLARRRLSEIVHQGAYTAALILALIYLAYPALGFVNRFEFHEEVLAVPLLLLAFWFLESRRPWLLSLALLLTLLCKEDLGLTVAAFAVYVALRDRRYRTLGLVWAAIGSAWTLIALLLIIPAFRGQAADALSRYAWLGSDARGILSGLLAQPAGVLGHLLGEPRRFWFLFKFLLPLGFFSLLSPAVLVALPALLLNWLAGNLYQASPYAHYAVPLIPVLFAAAVFGLARLLRQPGHLAPLTDEPASVGQPGEKDATQLSAARAGHQPSFLPQRRLAYALIWLLVCAGLALVLDQFWQQAVGPDDWEIYGLERRIDPEPFLQATALLPPDGSVATTEAYAPHLANRQQLFLLGDPRILQVVDRVDWVLVDVNDHRYGVQPKLYYGLLRWIAEERDLETCFFAGSVVLLGPQCGEAEPQQAYHAMLAELQSQVADVPLDPELEAYLGQHYFVALP